MAWNHNVTIKHLFTQEEDHASVQKSMNAIADVLQNDIAFILFLGTLRNFRSIPAGDDVFGPVDYANRLLDQMYDFANEYRIWIG